MTGYLRTVLSQWPLPALLAWGGSWVVFMGMLYIAPTWLALLVGSAVGTVASLWGDRWWRRCMIAAGFPLSLAFTGVAALPAWAWLVPLILLLLVYPLNAWRDAPVFPTPAGALDQLPFHVPLKPEAHVLDAGCGMGDGLQALHRAYPDVQLHGLEWSWPLRLLCAWRCPWAKVRRADIWAADWGGYQMVYLFQRPETMTRAALKAEGEMPAGSWLVSLDFAVPDAQPFAELETESGRRLHIYQLPLWPESRRAMEEGIVAAQSSPEAMAWQAIYPRREPPRIKPRSLVETPRKRMFGWRR